VSVGIFYVLLYTQHVFLAGSREKSFPFSFVSPITLSKTPPKEWSFSKLLFYSQIFPELLLCTTHCSRHWEYRGAKKKKKKKPAKAIPALMKLPLGS
jgi:hypothetical protein